MVIDRLNINLPLPIALTVSSNAKKYKKENCYLPGEFTNQEWQCRFFKKYKGTAANTLNTSCGD